jgi:NAD(P)-dependent dehydrogenase (short-subunit alcohol dehydrogenase family)
MSEEVKHHGVNVNCVLPSIIDTAYNRRDMPAADFSHWVAPQDLAQVIAFLLSDGSRAIHGAAIPVFGRV